MKRLWHYLSGNSGNEPPPTYFLELNRQCGIIAGPACLVCLLAWLPYISLDVSIYPHLPLIVWLRLGLTLVAGICLVLFLFDRFRRHSYYLLLALLVYLLLATALILGLVSADPAYMGGFSFILLVLPIMPFLKRNSIPLVFLALVVFFLIGRRQNMIFLDFRNQYGAFNLLAASMVSLLGIILMDAIRRRSYRDHLKLFQVSEELQGAYEEVRLINSELEKTSIALVINNEELKQVNRVKSELMGIVAHDLRNPLAVITGYTEFLREQIREHPDAEKPLQAISDSSDKIMKLITGLLENNAIEKGKLKMNLEKCDLGRLAEEIVNQTAFLAESKEQRLSIKTEAGCICLVDRMLIGQVFDNLVSNALKFTPPGREIKVKLEKKRNQAGALSFCFSVSDQGPGLTAEDKKMLFGRFQRLSARPTGGESSTGLGLSIIKELVELHQGRIVVDSEPGRGATFSVELPEKTAALESA